MSQHGYLTPAELAERERAHDLGKVRAARPKGYGECRKCFRHAQARFPVFVECLGRVIVEHLCAPCAMTPPEPDLHRYCCAIISRSEAERLLGVAA